MQIAPPEIACNSEGDLFMRTRPAIAPAQMVGNMRSALARGLPEVRMFRPHGQTLAIASGGPSLADTWQDLEGHVAAANGSLGFLLDKGAVPHFCGVCDANPHMADIVVADPRVRYLVASNCDPALFDKLLTAGCKVWVWHSTGISLGTAEADAVLREARPDTWLQIFGGATIGLRLVNLGYALGYRRFHLHGMDSSFRANVTHAYPDRRTGEWAEASAVEVNGYRTSLNFLQQVDHFARLLDRMSKPDTDPVQFEVFGDGLLQACWRRYRDANGTLTPKEAFETW